jgi:hypothetical protein
VACGSRGANSRWGLRKRVAKIQPHHIRLRVPSTTAWYGAWIGAKRNTADEGECAVVRNFSRRSEPDRTSPPGQSGIVSGRPRKTDPRVLGPGVIFRTVPAHRVERAIRSMRSVEAMPAKLVPIPLPTFVERPYQVKSTKPSGVKAVPHRHSNLRINFTFDKSPQLFLERKSMHAPAARCRANSVGWLHCAKVSKTYYKRETCR